MLDFETAYKTLIQSGAADVPRIGRETVSLADCLGRVLTEPVKAKLDLPPFAKSAMDGFAVLSDDTAEGYRILETIAAGDVPQKTVTRGTCSRIMTGAMMPNGADKVIRVEYTLESNGTVAQVTPEPYDNVIKMGENIQRGATVLEPKVLRAQDVGILAEQGIDSVPVAIPPLIGIIATGSELKDPGQLLDQGEIYNSNGSQLCAQVRAMSGRYQYYGIAGDSPDALSKVLADAAGRCHIVMLSGGVSMGDYDYVPTCLTDYGAEIVFHKVAVKPGKPMLYARREATHFIGLPGNPVSTFIIFEVLVKPFIYAMMGIGYRPAYFAGTLSEDIRRRDSSRLEFKPVMIDGDAIIPATYHGSSHLHALGTADGIVRIEQGVDYIKEGTKIYARQI